VTKHIIDAKSCMNLFCNRCKIIKV